MGPSSGDKPPVPSAVKDKKKVSIALTPGQSNQLNRALDEIEAHVNKIAPDWRALLPEQRDKLLATSPVLARVVKLARLFEERI